MGRSSLSSTPLLLLDLEELNYLRDLTSLSDFYEFACGIQRFSGEFGQALVHTALSQRHYLASQIKRSFCNPLSVRVYSGANMLCVLL